jgi:hypothetical protein
VRRSRPSRRNAGRPPGATGHMSGARTGRGSVPGSRHVVRAEQDALVYDAEGLHGNPSRARVAGGTIGPGVRALYQPTEKPWRAPLSKALRAAPPGARTDNVRFGRRPFQATNGRAPRCQGGAVRHFPQRSPPVVDWAELVNPDGHPQCGPSAEGLAGTAPPGPAPKALVLLLLWPSEAARKRRACEQLAFLPALSAGRQPGIHAGRDRSLCRGVVAGGRSNRDDQLLPVVGAAIAEGCRSGAAANLGAHSSFGAARCVFVPRCVIGRDRGVRS